MSEVTNISENQKNAVPEEQNVMEKIPAGAKHTPTPAVAETLTATEKQVVNNSSEVEEAAGDAGISAAEAVNVPESSPNLENKKTPPKRTPSKRISFIERAQKESEELVKNMGGSLELDGGRRTRSSTRGTPTRATAVSTPPPVKKARTSPANASNTPSRARGRGRKIDISTETAELDEAKGIVEQPATTTPDKSNTNNKKNATEDPKMTVKKAPEPAILSATSAEITEKSKEKMEPTGTEEPVSSGEQSEDNPDAVINLVVPTEGTQNNVEHTDVAIIDTPQEATATQQTDETPMETDEPQPMPVHTEACVKAPSESATAAEQPQTADATEKNIAITTKKPTVLALPMVETKHSTAGPMDVDSSSKSNDVVEVIDTPSSTPEVSVETVPPIPPIAAKSTSTPTNEALPAIAQVETVADTNTVVVESAIKINNIDDSKASVLEVVQQASCINVTRSAEPSTNAVNATNSVNTNTKAEAATETPVAESAVIARESKANNDQSVKPDNYLCVPKAVSPSINNAKNDGAVATIL